MESVIRDLFRACLLGGAVGDALGAPVEFMSRNEILRHFGKDGIREMVTAYGQIGAITDDTQMTLFTAEGMLRAYVRGATRGICHPPSVIAYAYLRWLHTQNIKHPLHDHCLNGWLIEQKSLFSRLAPGITCVSALQAMRSVGELAKNDSKGCGGVMRVAPIGMFLASQARKYPDSYQSQLRQSFDLACEASGITHGHPTGQLAAGAFSAIIFLLLSGIRLPEAIELTLKLLAQYPDHEETTHAIQNAVHYAATQPNSYDALRQLGEGWIAEESLAISLYCALCATDFESAVILSVNHDGDSDSTGSMTGQLMGVISGYSAIPSRWLEPLELKDILVQIADDLCNAPDWKLNDWNASEEGDFDLKRYPGG